MAIFHSQAVKNSMRALLLVLLVLALSGCGKTDPIDPHIISQNVEEAAFVVQKISILIGLYMLFAAIMRFKRIGEQRMMMGQASMASPLMMLLSSTCLLVLPQMIDVALYSFWGTSSPMSIQQVEATGVSASLLPIILFMRFLGICLFVRGFVMLGRAGREQSQPGTIGKAMTFILGGILNTHIVGTFELIHSLGGFL